MLGNLESLIYRRFCLSAIYQRENNSGPYQRFLLPVRRGRLYLCPNCLVSLAIYLESRCYIASVRTLKDLPGSNYNKVYRLILDSRSEIQSHNSFLLRNIVLLVFKRV